MTDLSLAPHRPTVPKAAKVIWVIGVVAAAFYFCPFFIIRYAWLDRTAPFKRTPIESVGLLVSLAIVAWFTYAAVVDFSGSSHLFLASLGVWTTIVVVIMALVMAVILYLITRE